MLTIILNVRLQVVYHIHQSGQPKRTYVQYCVSHYLFEYIHIINGQSNVVLI